MDKGPWNVDVNDPNLSVKACSSASWFGWKKADAVGSISTTLYGNGRATLQYANCNTQGMVVVYLNDAQIFVHAHTQTVETKEFEFFDGDVVKISEENSGVIQFNDLSISGCSGIYAVYLIFSHNFAT